MKTNKRTTTTLFLRWSYNHQECKDLGHLNTDPELMTRIFNIEKQRSIAVEIQMQLKTYIAIPKWRYIALQLYKKERERQKEVIVRDRFNLYLYTRTCLLCYMADASNFLSGGALFKRPNTHITPLHYFLNCLIAIQGQRVYYSIYAYEITPVFQANSIYLYIAPHRLLDRTSNTISTAGAHGNNFLFLHSSGQLQLQIRRKRKEERLEIM